MINNLFLTGDMQVGKSTIINRAIQSLGNAGGFKTQRYYEQDQLVGFNMKRLNDNSIYGERPLIGYCKENNWVAVPDTFDHNGVAILRECLAQKVRLIIMDEIGFFENQAYDFQNMIRTCLDSDIPVLGVLKQHNNSFINSIKARKDILLLTVTPARRERIANTVDLLLEEIL